LTAIVASPLLDALATSIGSVTVVLSLIRGVGFEPGYLTMIWSIGGVSSRGRASVARRIVARFAAGPAMAWGLAGTGIRTIQIAGAAGTDIAGEAFLVANRLVTDPFAMVWIVSSARIRQSVVPNHLTGRVRSVIRLGSSVVTISGLVLGGMLVPVLAMRAEVVAGGGAFIAGASCLLPIRLTAPVPSPSSRGDRPPPIALGALEPSPRVYRCTDGVSRSGKRTN